MSKQQSESVLLIRYLGSGALNTIVGFSVIFLLMAWGVSPLAANIIGYFIGFILGFMVAKKFVFRSNGHFGAENLRYLIAFVIAFLFNLLVLQLALIYSDFNNVTSQVLAALSYTSLMYILARLFVFNAKPFSLAFNKYSLVIYCIGIIVVFIVWVAGSPVGFGPLDDHYFMATIFQGKEFGFYISPTLGRFFPLTAQEYVIAAKLFGASAQAFYLINAFKLLICGGFLFRCLTLTRLGNFSVAILWTTVMFSMGIANTLFRLSAGEFNILILMLLFAYCVLMLKHKHDVISSKRTGYAIIGISAFSLALFYKELAFIFGLIFALSEIIRTYWIKKTKPSIFIVATLLVSVLYIVFYGIWHYIYVTGSYANLHAILLLDVITLFADNDPFIIFVILPVAAYRVVVVLCKPEQYSIYDSFLLSASAYACAFMLLRMFSPYYLLPSYAFAICGLAGILVENCHIITKRTILAFVLLCGINIFPMAFSDIQAQKLIAQNHFKFVSFLSGWLKANTDINRHRQNIVLEGVSPGNGVEIIHSIKTFIVSLGTPESTFEVKATEPSDNKFISKLEDQGYKPEVNDLLVFNPYQQVRITPPLHAPSYKEIYRSNSDWALPRWMVWNWINICLINRAACITNVSNSMRYTGYAAMLVTRESMHIAKPVPLSTPAYQLGALNIPERMKSGSTRKLDVLVQNTGSETWPADGSLLHPSMFVNLSYRWFDKNNQIVLYGDRVSFPEPIRSKDTIIVSVFLKTPDLSGKYKLIISPVQEGVRWFDPDNNFNTAKEIDIF